jgi:hypothetical protein
VVAKLSYYFRRYFQLSFFSFLRSNSFEWRPLISETSGINPQVTLQYGTNFQAVSWPVLIIANFMSPSKPLSSKTTHLILDALVAVANLIEAFRPVGIFTLVDRSADVTTAKDNLSR